MTSILLEALLATDLTLLFIHSLIPLVAPCGTCSVYVRSQGEKKEQTSCTVKSCCCRHTISSPSVIHPKLSVPETNSMRLQMGCMPSV